MLHRQIVVIFVCFTAISQVSSQQPELTFQPRLLAIDAIEGIAAGDLEMSCLYDYTWNATERVSSRHTIDEGRVGCGLQIVTANLNDDNKMDIAVAGKSGTYLLLAQ